MKHARLLALAAVALTVSACGTTTQTRQQAAVNAVCGPTGARALVASEVANLQANVVTPGTPAAVRASVSTITANTRIIAGASRTMPAVVGRPVFRTARAFSSQFRLLAPALLQAPDGPAPAPRYLRYSNAVARVGPAYQHTLGTVSCG
jgi:hypothetical protein